MKLRDEVAQIIQGEVTDNPMDLLAHSRDTSIFERMPSLVVFPRHGKDVSALVKLVAQKKRNGEQVSLTARAAGTDMTGGPLTDSIVVAFSKHMNRVLGFGKKHVIAEPGVYYRDLEKETRARGGMIVPPYPASREICALGGMIANNAGGELTLHYGKMDSYVEELDVVLADGSEVTLKKLSEEELAQKKRLETLEGAIYRTMHALIEHNWDEIRKAKPSVSKNSAGYALWDVWDPKKRTFDLTRLFCGAQGTLGLITRSQVGLEKPKSHRGMVVIFLSDLSLLPEVVKRVLTLSPESFESYDDHTFKLATRFAGDFIRQGGIRQMLSLGFAFLPEMWMAATGGIPKLVLLAEFAEKTEEEAKEKAREARALLSDLPVKARLAFGVMEDKYWKIRRESFALLRKHIHGLRAAPFIDDIVVHPKDYPEFLPELNTLLSEYDIMYTIAGHIGDGNFHIIPLVDLKRPEHHTAILGLTPRVYQLVAKYKGSITGEHSDGIIRTPFLSLMFSERMLQLFAETKRIFDPQNIFNPGKKVGGTIRDIEKYMIGTPKL